MLISEECKGCRLDGNCFYHLNPKISETVQCPCIDCLVKAMCSEACEEWREYIRLNGSLKKRKVINVNKRSM
jgi:hypothetical protein